MKQYCQDDRHKPEDQQVEEFGVHPADALLPETKHLAILAEIRIFKKILAKVNDSCFSIPKISS